MSAGIDMGPGTVVEVYRGQPDPPMTLGSRWTVARLWHEPRALPCELCLPGYDAPCIDLVEIDTSKLAPSRDFGPLCSCSFRPVRPPRAEPQTTIQSAPEPVPADA